MDRVKIAVIGTGHVGSIHARIYKQIPACELLGVCDIDPKRLKEVSSSLGVPGYRDYQELLGKVDAASVATPANLHYRIASDFLKNKAHVLVEKPFTTSLEEADALIALSQKQRLILQVGHIERFNSAFSATKKIIREPRFIESHRLSPFPNRAQDVGVVLDVMIHDIDIILGLVSSPVKAIESVGIPVLTQFEDIANSRITFEDGCVANLTASRVSDEVMRKIRIFQENTYISLDYRGAQASVYRKEGSRISKEDLPIEKEEPLPKELGSFIDCILKQKEPLVSGPVAREALAVALLIQNQIWHKNTS